MDGAKKTVIAAGLKNGPRGGITWHEDAFYIAEGGQMEGGMILKIKKEGSITPLIGNLPSVGDHHTNGPVVMNGFVYFSQATATNSGVVEKDNANFGGLERHPSFHDFPYRYTRKDLSKSPVHWKMNARQK